MDATHIPVLLEESLDALDPGRGGLFVDATLGLGGHAEALLDRFDAARLLGLDRDPDARAAAAARLARFGDRARVVAGNFHRLAEAVGDAAPVAGVLADLGVSSLQLDTAARGFSFRREGPLDMRMGGSDLTAEDVVNRYPEADLERIFREYGEERQARRIARAVVEERRRTPLGTTTQLKALIDRAKGLERAADGRGRAREGRVDPATRVFQALRIEVNQELAGLAGFIDQAVRMLATDGRLVVISYHSLEDRIVKNRLRDLGRGEVDRVTGRPLAETKLIEVLTRKPVRPSEGEVRANPRSRSARLRAARRT
ncbi:MAG TPA: 16S rRNA (cytosine(1402)-N(4))-methyltransferase RsmH [Thermoanaerobaculia bacterium]|nr:16S rRNA (cytosine(1402)-N(4))-methyltransferase RsmH [Thermoanaerobaculia bacterium]